jgi:hypothetical protein
MMYFPLASKDRLHRTDNRQSEWSPDCIYSTLVVTLQKKLRCHREYHCTTLVRKTASNLFFPDSSLEGYTSGSDDEIRMKHTTFPYSIWMPPILPVNIVQVSTRKTTICGVKSCHILYFNGMSGNVQSQSNGTAIVW